MTLFALQKKFQVISIRHTLHVLFENRGGAADPGRSLRSGTATVTFSFRLILIPSV